MTKINTTGLDMPDIFPSTVYDEIQKNFIAKKKNEEKWKEHGIAWNAISYRYLSLKKYNDDYVASITKYGGSPLPEIRVGQEELIFNFFTTGFSLLDIIGYGIYAICSEIDTSNFPLTNDIKPNINICMVKDKLVAYFTNEDITTSLKTLIESNEYKEWKDIRNILAHRGQPPRAHYAGGEKDGKSEWINGMVLNTETLSKKLNWIDKTLVLLMEDIKKLSEKL